MKKSVLILLTCVFGMVGTMAAQPETLDDYVYEERGDTLVIKTVTQMQNDFSAQERANAIVNAVEADSQNVPEGRVYGLQRGGLYFVTQALQSPSDRKLVIAGLDDTPMHTGSDEAGPPIYAGTEIGGTVDNSDLVHFNNDVTLKNAMFLPAATDGSQGWDFLNEGANDATIRLDNILSEHTNWVFIRSNDNSGTRLFIEDSYFVNLSGNATRRNGGVYDNVSNNTHTVSVENTTHVMFSGMAYKFRNFPVNKAYFNHNTFVNVSGQLFVTMGYQSDWTVTNNLFVNSNVQAYYPGLDYGETDQDSLPMGIINVDELRTDGELNISEEWITENTDVSLEEFGPDDRKILVDKNGVFWDDRLSQIPEELNASQDSVTFVAQTMTMNSRTQEMFNDDETYPYLTEGEWIRGGDPNFAEPNGLMGDMVDSLITWSVNAVPSSSSYLMYKWRSDDNPANNDNYVFPDWPVYADLSYDNSDYLNAGLGGYPLGDLNWFPNEKSAWMAESESLRDEIEAAKNEGRVPTPIGEEFSDIDQTPRNISLSQNYPNPFNPTTQIQFELNQPSDVQLKIYNVTGQLVKTLVNKELGAGKHAYQWSATNEMGRTVSSGVYIYQLKTGEQTLSKTMTFIK